MQGVVRQSCGQYRLGPGTLYDNLQKLMRQGLLEEAPRQSGGDDPRRRYYRFTKLMQFILASVGGFVIMVVAATLWTRRFSKARSADEARGR